MGQSITCINYMYLLWDISNHTRFKKELRWAFSTSSRSGVFMSKADFETGESGTSGQSKNVVHH